MRYRGDTLKAQFLADKINERKAAAPVMATHTCERQEALAAARTHDKIFCVMGDEHVTPDNICKAAKINKQITDGTKREKEKKSWIAFHDHAWHEAALPILQNLLREERRR
jgi:hypothetical protein